MIPLILAALIQVPPPVNIPRLRLTVKVHGSTVSWKATNATECWVTDLAGALLTPDLPPQGSMSFPAGNYIIYARGVRQEVAQGFTIGFMPNRNDNKEYAGVPKVSQIQGVTK